MLVASAIQNRYFVWGIKGLFVYAAPRRIDMAQEKVKLYEKPT
jgi:hypothetical protein